MSRVKSTQLTQGQIARLRSELHRHGIKQRDVAEAAGVTKHMVCHVLARRAVSRNVVETAKRLISDAKARGTCAA